MTLLVDTSVWSSACRRDSPPEIPEVGKLVTSLAGAEDVVTTGIVMLELLRGFVPKQVEQNLEERFAAMTLVEPRREDYVAAARLGRTCREAGVQLGTVDSLIAQLAIANDLTLLTTDRDCIDAARHVPVKVWTSPSGK